MNIVEHKRSVEPADLPDDYLHVVVFGPGHGEAVLVRTADGRVGVVDGCGGTPLATRRGSPIFGLLDALGEKHLLFACLTHPHRDHFGGFAEMVKKHRPEHLWWSGTYERRFFSSYIKYLKNVGRSKPVSASTAPLTDDLRGVVDAITQLTGRLPKGAMRPRAENLQGRGHILNHASTGRADVHIESILPSPAGVRAAEKDALKVVTGAATAANGIDPNRISAALLISWGTTRVLLGGDALKGSAKDHEGWDGLQFPLEKVHVLKVPHHASINAHSDTRWAEMRPDLAIVTCVQYAADKQPPRADRLQKLLQTGSRIALTSRPTWWSTEPHPLTSQPTPWAPSPATVPSGNPGLPGGATPAYAANEHENAVVVRLDDKGTIVQVQLHGAARELREAVAAAAAP